MKTKHLLLVTCLSLVAVTTTNSQIINPVQPDLPIGPAPGNTGVALAPNEDIQAAVFDDAGGTYKIFWLDSWGAILDADGNPGNDPDVAYYANADALVVAYELGGDIYVDDYYLVSLFPVDYQLNGSNGIHGGSYPNVDMNSAGNGVLTWEVGGDIWACSFTIGPFTAGPPTMMAPGGTQPDIILLDDNTTVALTYVEFGGNLIVSTYDYSMLQMGAPAMTGMWNYPPMMGYRYPRIAGQRNAAFGPSDLFTVVAQDFNGVGSEVHGFFNTGGGSIIGPKVMNDGLVNCPSYDPYPVVTYERDQVHVAWSQRYSTGAGSCAPGVPGGASGSDVLMGKYDFGGGNIFGGPVYFRINQMPSAFAGISKNALNSEYDGGYGIGSSNYHEAILYSDPSELYWKTVNAGNPSYIPTQDELSGDDVFTLTNSPVSEVIEVVSSDDALANFELYDNAGRLIEITQVSHGNNTYSIDISHLSGGTYLLKCSSSASEEVLRILQVNR